MINNYSSKFGTKDELYIETLLKNLVALQSDTGSEKENEISKYIFNKLSELPYFCENNSHFGIDQIPDDTFGRSIVWGLVKGKGSNTVVLMNHHDAVDLSAYGEFGQVALSPELIKCQLKKSKTNPDVEKDLNDPDWMFGRGTADMKAGIAIQMWSLAQLSAVKNLEGNVLFLSVGDEENLSAGMRHAVSILNKLQSEFSLDLKYAINSEPYDRNDDESPIYYEGSVGKVMPVIYARGKTSHVGQVYSGLNPTFMLSNVQSRIELNTDFSDDVQGEVSAPPTLIYVRDRKNVYDASLPESAVAYFSVLTMTSTPSQVINRTKSLCIDAFKSSVKSVEDSFKRMNERSNYYTEPPNLQERVMTYDELTTTLINSDSPCIKKYLYDLAKDVSQRVNGGFLNLQEATIEIIEKTVSLLPDNDPLIVVAYSGPLYPHVCNLDFDSQTSEDIKEIIQAFTKDKWDIAYCKRNYFLGISDFSYASFVMDNHEIETIGSNMPGWGELYHIPLEELKLLKMKLVNLGPRGKDIHKMTERVSKQDAFERIPQLMMHFITSVLGEEMINNSEIAM